jgi:hypothetical protein
MPHPSRRLTCCQQVQAFMLRVTCEAQPLSLCWLPLLLLRELLPPL